MSELHVPESTNTLARAQNVISDDRSEASDDHIDTYSQSDMSTGVVRQIRTFKNENGEEYEQSVADSVSDMNSVMSYQNYDTPE